MRVKTMWSVTQSALWDWWNDNCMAIGIPGVLHGAVTGTSGDHRGRRSGLDHGAAAGR